MHPIIGVLLFIALVLFGVISLEKRKTKREAKRKEWEAQKEHFEKYTAPSIIAERELESQRLMEKK